MKTKFYYFNGSKVKYFVGYSGSYIMGLDDSGWFAYFPDGRKEMVDYRCEEFDDFVFNGTWRETEFPHNWI